VNGRIAANRWFAREKHGSRFTIHDSRLDAAPYVTGCRQTTEDFLKKNSAKLQ
jgi:hypothetical protein